MKTSRWTNLFDTKLIGFFSFSPRNLMLTSDFIVMVFMHTNTSSCGFLGIISNNQFHVKTLEVSRLLLVLVLKDSVHVWKISCEFPSLHPSSPQKATHFCITHHLSLPFGNITNQLFTV
jgi:hypothetical protein